MGQTEIWLTKIFNDHLAGLGNWLLSLVGMQAQPRPWSNFVSMELLVVLIIMVVFALLLIGSLSRETRQIPADL